MDSHAYLQLIYHLTKTRNNLFDSIPASLRYPGTAPQGDDGFTQWVIRFIDKLAPESRNSIPAIQSRPDILTLPLTQNHFTMLFYTLHVKIAQALKKDKGTSFRRNGTELVSFLSHAVSPKWVPLFHRTDSISSVMCCFLLEACMFLGWCPNAFENRAKRAAHLYFSHFKKTLYQTPESQIFTLLGYLVCAWFCAQKTEGIRDGRLIGESKDIINRFSWEIADNGSLIRLQYHMYRYLKPPFFLLIPEYQKRVPHPVSRLQNEGKLGLQLFYNKDNEIIVPAKIVASKSIDRALFKGKRFSYTCKTKNDVCMNWTSVFQIYKTTIYRIDILRPVAETLTISHAELRLENYVQLVQTSKNSYIGQDQSEIVIEFCENPFCFTYQGQAEYGISLFTGKDKILTPKTSLEIITAWSWSQEKPCIDHTYLLGVFEMENPESR